MFYKRRSDETECIDDEQQSCTEGLYFSHMFIVIKRKLRYIRRRPRKQSPTIPVGYPSSILVGVEPSWDAVNQISLLSRNGFTFCSQKFLRGFSWQAEGCAEEGKNIYLQLINPKLGPSEHHAIKTKTNIMSLPFLYHQFHICFVSLSHLPIEPTCQDTVSF